MTQPFPRKYWWAVLIATPLLVSAIAIVPYLFSDPDSSGDVITISGTNISGSVQIVGTQNILNEIEQVVSDPAELQALRKSVEKAINLVKGGFTDGAIEAFEKIAEKYEIASIYSNIGALKFEMGNQVGSLHAYETAMSLDPDSGVLINNLATLYEKQGRTDEAQRQLERVKDSDGARESVPSLGSAFKTEPAMLIESEDNGTMDSANRLQLGSPVTASIASKTDLDVFTFNIPSGPRDYIEARIRPVDSGKLKSTIQGYNARRARRWSESANNSGELLSKKFIGSPGETYYLTVNSWGHISHHLTGEYQLTVDSLLVYDRHEPNENILEATDIGEITQVSGSILDENDSDYYAFVAAGEKTNFKFTNESSQLTPEIKIWGADKARLEYFYASSAGQDLSRQLALKTGGRYYISVHGSGQGAYTLNIE